MADIPLSPEWVEALVQERTTSLLTDREVCVLRGVSYAQARRWLRRGCQDDAPRLHSEFARRWGAAQMHHRSGLLFKVAQGGKDAQAAQWLLERMPLIGDQHLDVEQIRAESLQKAATLDDVLRELPDELVDAARRNPEAIRKLLAMVESAA